MKIVKLFRRSLWVTTTLLVLALIVYDAVTVSPQNLISLLGIMLMLIFSYTLSTCSADVNWGLIGSGVVFQLVVGLIVMRWPTGNNIIAEIASLITGFLNYGNYGARCVFGETYTEHGFALSVMPLLCFFTAVISSLYYLGALQSIVRSAGGVLQSLIGTSSVESFVATANIFFGPDRWFMELATVHCPKSQFLIPLDLLTLDDEQRNVLFDKLNAAPETFGYIIDILSPNYISNSMLRRTKYNLNQVSHDTAIGLIRSALGHGVKVKEVYVDTVGDPTKYQDMLKSVFPHLDITVAKKADSTYPIVSAASICAKVARDRVVEKWKFIEKVDAEEMDYGSGYPSDPKTKRYLQSVDNVFGFGQFVRFSWSTADVILKDKAVAVHWEDDDDDDKPVDTSVPSVLSFFKSADKSQHIHFVERSLKTFTSF